MIVLRLCCGADRIHARPLSRGGRVTRDSRSPAARCLEAVAHHSQRAIRRHRGVDHVRCAFGIEPCHAVLTLRGEVPAHLRAAVCRRESRVPLTIGCLHQRLALVSGTCVDVDRRATGDELSRTALVDREGYALACGQHRRRTPRRIRERHRRRAHPPHEQALLDVAADDGAAREVRVVVPQPVVAARIVVRIGVKARDQGRRQRPAGSVEHAQAAAVVRFEDERALGVDVVVDRRAVLELTKVGQRRRRVVEAGRIEHARERAIVRLVVVVQARAIRREPRLVREARIRIGDVRQRHRRCLVRHIDDVDAYIREAAVQATAADGELTRPATGTAGRVSDYLSFMHIAIEPPTHIHGALRRGAQVIDAQAVRAAASSVKKT